MQFFRFLHRRTKSEGDISTLLRQPDLAENQAERSVLEQDLDDHRTDLFHTRAELYSQMLCNARQQQEAMHDFRTIQMLEARHQRFCTLLVDIGIPRATVDTICQVVRSGHGSPEDILVDAIEDASNDSGTLLSRMRPVIKLERTPEHYQAALNLTLSIRKELKCQKKRSKFWKKLAQEDGRHAVTITPSPSDMSSIRQYLSPERQNALDTLIVRRRAARYSENDADVFGGRQRESTLDSLASSLASRPRHSIQDNFRLSSSFSSSASSASTTYLPYLSSISRILGDSTIGTPAIPSRLPSPLSTSLRRASRSSSQSIVLGSISLNLSRSSPTNPTPPEGPGHGMNPDTATATVTVSQDLLQNVKHVSQGHGHHRRSSATSRRSVTARSTHSSFRLSAFSPIPVGRPIEQPTVPSSDISGTSTAIDTPSFHTSDVVMRLSDLMTNTNSGLDTPISTEVTKSDGTPFNNTPVLSKYADTPFSPTDLGPQVASTPLDECQSLDVNTYSRDTRFLEHMDSCTSMTMSITESDGHEHERGSDSEHDREGSHVHTDTDTAGTLPVDDSKDSLFTTSASSLSANETPAPTTPPTPSPSPVPDFDAASPRMGKTSIGRSMLPVLAKHLRRLSLTGTSPDRERLMDKLRLLRSLSRSRSRSGPASPPVGVWQGSPARSEESEHEHLTPSPGPVKGSGIPVLQRRMTIRARRMSVRKV